MISKNVFREDCEQSETFTDEEIDRSVGLYWTNAFGCSEGNGQAIFPTFRQMSMKINIMPFKSLQFILTIFNLIPILS